MEYESVQQQLSCFLNHEEMQRYTSRCIVLGAVCPLLNLTYFKIQKDRQMKYV